MIPETAHGCTLPPTRKIEVPLRAGFDFSKERPDLRPRGRNHAGRQVQQAWLPLSSLGTDKKMSLALPASALLSVTAVGKRQPKSPVGRRLDIDISFVLVRCCALRLGTAASYRTLGHGWTPAAQQPNAVLHGQLSLGVSHGAISAHPREILLRSCRLRKF